MDAKSNSKIITLGDYIKSVSEEENQVKESTPNINDYKVYPEDDGYDRYKNPFSSH